MDNINSLPHSWHDFFNSECTKTYYKQLKTFVDTEYSSKTIFPPQQEIYSAFKLCPLDNLKVVIIGQDPYHGKGQAHGLAFSVNEGVRIPPSLMNIYKELNADIGKPIPTSGNLEEWARQGVLLINATLTVEEGKAGSHQKHGWEEFTDHLIDYISTNKEGLVFILWGSFAQSKGKNIDRTKNLVLESAHPSPLSAYRGFFGNHHFSLTNTYLKEKGLREIKW